MLAWYRQQNRSLPWRERFLQTGDPLGVWVSEIMLQQTTIQAVIPAYQRFFEHFPDIYGLSRASEAEVRLACRGLGYYRRFHFLHRAAQQLVAEAHPKVRWPQDFQGWRALPGVGDYTAAAISSIAFGVPKGVVDGNVERVLCRLLDLRIVVDPKWKKPFQSLMDSLVDPDSPGDFNQAMMELGQTVCTKQNPLCSKCPLQIVCRAYRNTSQDLAPQPKPAPTYEEVTLHVAIATHKGSVGLDHRLADARFLKGTLGFPCAIETSPRALLWETNYQFARSKKPFAKFKHSITKHKITGLVHDLGEFPHKDRSLTWIAWGELESQLVSNLDRKAWKSFVAQRGRD
jgi:A/G-specific adenine glycosylase